jgi:hypothetical protein
MSVLEKQETPVRKFLQPMRSKCFWWVTVFNRSLSQQVKMDKIAKNMIPNANSAERNPKSQCDIHKKNMDHIIF